MNVPEIPHSFSRRHRWLGTLALLFSVAVLPFLLGACGGPEPTPQVVIVTATYTPKPLVIVVTATFTPSTGQATSGETPSPPASATLLPTSTPSPTASTTPEPTATLQPTPTSTPAPSQTRTTKTFAPATLTPGPVASSVASSTATSTPKPTSKPVSLQSYLVVYTSWKGPALQDYSLWSMNGDGSGNSKILDQASEPAFSPDRNRLAFSHWTDGIYVYNLSSENVRKVVGNSEAALATWAPDGNRLAYWNLLGQDWIHLVNADGSDDRQLSPGLRPNWSLNGGFIAYDTCENNRCGIFRINPGGGGKKQLTDDAGGGAAVSPDGTRIAYWSQADGDFELYVVNADGSGRKQLTRNTGNDALPAWSPDGRYLYYLSDQDGKGWAVMVMNADGSNPRKVVGVGVSPDPSRGWRYQRMTVTWNR